MSLELPLLPEERKEDWSKEQDALLRNLVSLYGTHDWAMIAEQINITFPYNPKSPKECSRRWQDCLNGNTTKEPWTEQEELNMIIAHKKFKNRWSEMADYLKGRSNNTIKNKFYSVFRKIKGKIQKNDCSFDSKLELLEIYYIISLIEFYLAHPTQSPKTKGKRGKDFIYSLIHNLTPKMVEDYKMQVQELARNEGSMDDLFNELGSRLRFPSDHAPTMHQTPARPRPEEPDKNVRIEFIPNLPPTESSNTIKSTAVPMSFEEDEFFKVPLNYKEETSPLFEENNGHPQSMFSPPPLSAGPAAAAEHAGRAAIFNNPVGGFSDLSQTAKMATEEKTVQHIVNRPSNYTFSMNRIPDARNSKCPTIYPGFVNRHHQYYYQ